MYTDCILMTEEITRSTSTMLRWASAPVTLFVFCLSQLHLRKGNFLVLKAKELGLPVWVSGPWELHGRPWESEGFSQSLLVFQWDGRHCTHHCCCQGWEEYHLWRKGGEAPGFCDFETADGAWTLSRAAVWLKLTDTTLKVVWDSVGLSSFGCYQTFDAPCGAWHLCICLLIPSGSFCV